MTTFTTEDRLNAIKAGAEQQGDDDKNYRELPCHTIYSTDGKPYLSIIEDDNLIKMRMHNYDDLFDRGIYFTVDRKAIPELIKALEQIE